MKKELTPEEKEQQKEYKKLWYLSNKERLLVKAKEYREDDTNKEAIKKLKQDWYENNKEAVKENVKNWKVENHDRVKEYKENYYINNKVEILEKNKKYRNENENKIKEYREKNKIKLTLKSKNWRGLNVEKIKKYTKSYREENKNKINKNAIRYYKNRILTDTLYKTKKSIRGLISQSFILKGFKKNCKTLEILGCSFEEFKLHMENQFEPWMNWDNYGNPKDGIYELNKTWDIDHITPLAIAKTEDDVIKLNHYTNLQPLCSYTNRFVKRGN